MFSKKSTNGVRNLVPRHIPVLSWQDSLHGSAKSIGASVISPELLIVGNVVSNGNLIVDGTIQGDIHCNSLIVGEAALVSGDINSNDVVVKGNVQGSIRSTRVSLAASSQIEGDVYHKTLAIEQGAVFEGKSRRTDDPESISTEPTAAAPNPQANGADTSSIQTQTPVPEQIILPSSQAAEMTLRFPD